MEILAVIAFVLVPLGIIGILFCLINILILSLRTSRKMNNRSEDRKR